MTAARLRFAAAAALAGMLAMPPLRHWMEAGMASHMLIQFPALLAAGALLWSGVAAASDTAFGARIVALVRRWNALGLAGLLFCALVLAIAMIPRLLDLALVDARVEALKWLALVACGAALRASWREAGLVVQGFWLGNVLPMTAVVGMLFQDAPLRLCNSYRLDEQQLVGTALVTLAVAVGLAWFGGVAIRLARNTPEGSTCSHRPHVPEVRLSPRAAGAACGYAFGHSSKQNDERKPPWQEGAFTTTSRKPSATRR